MRRHRERAAQRAVRLIVPDDGRLAMVFLPTISHPSPLFPPSRKEADAHRVAQVVAMASREEILKLGKEYQRLIDSGIPDSALIDRSLGVGRVFCCGGLPESAGTNVIWFYR